MALTDDAKAEIREAMRIIREDRFEAFARGRLSALSTPPKSEDNPKAPEVGNPPPPKEGDPQDPPKRKSAYWGELLTEDE